jgi:excisionase family DNA binding protein
MATRTNGSLRACRGKQKGDGHSSFRTRTVRAIPSISVAERDRREEGDSLSHSEPAVTASYLLVEEVARMLRCSTRSVHELTRRREIPHRRLPGTRRCLFSAADIAAWMDGAPLEVVELPRNGRVVRPQRREGRRTPSPLAVAPASFAQSPDPL